MLQFQTKSINICRISELLVKYNIKSSITDSVITLEGDIPDDLLTQLCDRININGIQNFISQEPLSALSETSFSQNEKSAQAEVVEKPKDIATVCAEEKQQVEKIQATPILSHNTSEYDIIYSKVKRGEVYLCDFGEPYGSEQGFMRYAIIAQNDDGNFHSPTTIVIACTSEHKKRLPVHLHCAFSSSNMVDYDLEKVGSTENVIMAEQIRTVDKTRLRKYLGMLTTDFMEQIDEKLNISLQLSQKVMVDPNAPKERKDVNMVQIRLLSFVDINELLKISQEHATDEVKAEKILKLFGFDFNKKGVLYVLKAIIASPKDVYFNLETLSESVSKEESIDKEEVKRLIVARVKETFGFRKAPTVDFIRLVNSFLLKQEDNNEEINI